MPAKASTAPVRGRRTTTPPRRPASAVTAARSMRGTTVVRTAVPATGPRRASTRPPASRVPPGVPRRRSSKARSRPLSPTTAPSGTPGRPQARRRARAAPGPTPPGDRRGQRPGPAEVRPRPRGEDRPVPGQERRARRQADRPAPAPRPARRPGKTRSGRQGTREPVAVVLGRDGERRVDGPEGARGHADGDAPGAVAPARLARRDRGGGRRGERVAVGVRRSVTSGTRRCAAVVELAVQRGPVAAGEGRRVALGQALAAVVVAGAGDQAGHEGDDGDDHDDGRAPARGDLAAARPARPPRPVRRLAGGGQGSRAAYPSPPP